MIAVLLALLAAAGAAPTVAPGRPSGARTRAESYFKDGLASWRDERWARAQLEFEMAVAMGRFTLPAVDLLEALRMAAESALRAGDAAAALRHARELAALAGERGRPLDRLRAANRLAEAWLESGRPQEAARALEGAARELAAIPDAEERGRFEGLSVRLAATGGTAPVVSLPPLRTPAPPDPPPPAPPTPLPSPPSLPTPPPGPTRVPATPAPSPAATPSPVASPSPTPDGAAFVPAGVVPGSPARRIAPFRLARREVTRREFLAFLAATGHRPTAGELPPAGPGGDDEPLRGVSFADGLAYARWAGGRLPLESEWERAARGRDGRRYSFGSRFDPSAARVGRRSEDGPLAAGAFAPNPFGISDLTGNVAEWCLGADGQGVLKGGAWNAGPEAARSDARVVPPPGAAPAEAGLRLAFDDAR